MDELDINKKNQPNGLNQNAYPDSKRESENDLKNKKYIEILDKATETWYYLCREEYIFQEDNEIKMVSDVISTGIFGLSAPKSILITRERIKNHVLSLEKKLDLFRKILQKGINLSESFINDLRATEQTKYGKFRVLLAGYITDSEIISVDIGAAAEHILFCDKKNMITGIINSVEDLARRYELTCFNKRKIPQEKLEFGTMVSGPVTARPEGIYIGKMTLEDSETVANEIWNPVTKGAVMGLAFVLAPQIAIPAAITYYGHKKESERNNYSK